MHITGIGTASPPARYTKAECLAAFETSDWFARLDARAHHVARLVLGRDNGIEARRLSVGSLAEVFEIDPDVLDARFAEHAPRLATEAGAAALASAALAPADVDAVIVSTCTGYLCPGLSGYVVERLGLRSDVRCFDLVGQGCAAAVPNLQLGRSLVDSGAAGRALSVCVEVSSAAMYLDNDPGVLISACLFGDGAGAAVLSAAPEPGALGGRRVLWRDDASLIEPARRGALRFEKRAGLLRNVLTRAVPNLAGEYARRALDTVLDRTGAERDEIVGWAMHAGGRDVLQALERDLELDPRALRHSAALLAEHGNLSSAFVYFVLEAMLAEPVPDGLWWLSSFGAGFSCHGALLEVS